MILASSEDGYLNFVQAEAGKLGKVFILDSGEGNDFEDSKTGWYVEDLSGWLISESLKGKLLKDKESNKVYETFVNEYTFVKWYIKDDEELAITFKKY